MSVQRRYFFSFVTLAAAAATPALGQTAPSAAPSTGEAAQSATPIPDFSGIWAHPYFPGFERPASGPGPIVNKSRRRDGVGNANQFVGDYTNPILKLQAAEVVRKYGEISLACETYIFFQHDMQMLQLPEEVTFLYLRNHEFRQVRLNQPHPTHVATKRWRQLAGIAGLEPAASRLTAARPHPVGLMPKLGGPPGNRNPSSALQERRAPVITRGPGARRRFRSGLSGSSDRGNHQIC
jgi:hypothetical protein